MNQYKKMTAVLSLIFFWMTGCGTPPAPSKNIDIKVVNSGEVFFANTLNTDKVRITIDHVTIDKNTPALEEIPELSIQYSVTSKVDQEIDALSSWFNHFQVIQVTELRSGEEFRSPLTLSESSEQDLTKGDIKLLGRNDSQTRTVSFQLIQGDSLVEIEILDENLSPIGLLHIDAANALAETR